MTVFGNPHIGFGTWKNTDPDECANSVQTALELGYRHIDTAQLYENERYVGRGIREADVDRDDVVLATKLWPGDLAYDRVTDAFSESLDKLGVDYVDILYVHWPAKDYDASETLEAFAELQRADLIEHVGVSNFTPSLLEEAEAASEISIAVNQVELHPLLPQPDLVDYCAANDIEVVAYSPLARGNALQVPEIQSVADTHDVSAAQVTLAWLLSKEGVRPIPKATSESHIRDNLQATDLGLTEAEINRIDSIDRRERFADRDWVDW